MVFRERERSEERFSRNAETDLVCRLLLEKKKDRPVDVLPAVHPHVALRDRILVVDRADAEQRPRDGDLVLLSKRLALVLRALSLHDALPIWHNATMCSPNLILITL